MTVLNTLPNDLIDGLLANYKKPEDFIGENGLINRLVCAHQLACHDDLLKTGMRV